MKINSISASATEYPGRLSMITGKPQKIYWRGELPSNTRTHATIIGTRKPTPYGIDVTTRIARGLAERGVVIVSGLALGVDALAHRGALNGNGITVAVLGCGVDRVYPASHRELAEQILQSNGALLSEYEPGMPVMKYRFLERNRIVSGLSDIIIVTEASGRSGTFNTITHALEQGRDVYAVPGPVTSPMSRGCNQLIAQGATPIVDVDEFIDTIAPSVPTTAPMLVYSEAEQAIIDLIRQGITDGDTLHMMSRLDAGVFAQTLTILELRGAIRPLGANQWSI